MARFHNINGEHVAFTPEEESERDAEEATWAAGENDRAMAALRQERDQKLADTDWWAMPDSPTMSEAQTQYRQDLRDFPSTVDINNIVWPTKP
tara:strand:+ start:331 stop:609 length:279 start_codon:yes stop_codon:yes gene_type:complete